MFAVGSTVALITIEYEEGLREDLFNVLERVALRNAEYKHTPSIQSKENKNLIRLTV